MKKIEQCIVVILIASGFVSSETFAQSSSCSILWYPPVQLTDSSYSSFKPEIELTGEDTVHLTWYESPGVHKIPYRRSINGGNQWEAIQELATDSILFPKIFLTKKLSVQGTRVYIFSGGESEPPGRMALSKSTNAGTTWTSYRTASDATTNIKSGQALSDTLVVVYAPWIGGFLQEPRLTYSTDDGFTWIQHPDTFHYYTIARLTHGSLHIVTDVVVPGSREIEYRRSTNLGQTYDHIEILSTVDNAWGFEHDMATRITPTGVQLYAVWRDEIACQGMAGCTIFSRQSTDNGLTWQPVQTVTEQPQGYEPSCAINPHGRAVVAWSNEMSFNGFIHIVSRVQKEDNVTWFPTLDQTPTAVQTEHPTVAISKNAVHVVWTQRVSSSRWCLFYQRGEFIPPNTSVVSYEEGWNLVSLPFRKDTVYDNFQSLYYFNNGYIPTDTMKLGQGYWAKTVPTTITYTGEEAQVETVAVTKGWNLIGSLSCPFHIANIVSQPPGILMPEAHGFKNGLYYQAEVIEPGRAYWMKVTQDGVLILKTD